MFAVFLLVLTLAFQCFFTRVFRLILYQSQTSRKTMLVMMIMKMKSSMKTFLRKRSAIRKGLKNLKRHMLNFVLLCKNKSADNSGQINIFQRIFAFTCGAEFRPHSQSKKVYFFPNSAIFFSQWHTIILFHPFIPIHQINSPRTPDISVIYFVCKHVQ